MLGKVNLSGVGAIALGTGGLAALAGNALRLGFSVDEPEMFVRLRFQCALTNGAADEVDFGLQLTTDQGTPALIDGGALFRKGLSGAGYTHDGVAFEWLGKLPRGKHVLELFADQVGAASESIDTDVMPAALTVERVTNEAVLGHGVESKVFHAQ